MPPAGFWPLGIVGVGILAWRLAGLGAWARAAAGLLAGIALFAPTLSWVEEFTAPGYVLLVLFEGAFVAAAAVIAGRRYPLALAPALVLTEWARATVPWGGLPMGGIALGQAAGPLAPVARLGGTLLVAGVAAALGAATVPPRAAAGSPPARRLASSVARATLAVVLVALLVMGARAAPDGGPDGEEVAVAAVQGGGRRGFRAVDTDATEVYLAHLDASEDIVTPVDLVLWPEDVIDVEGPVDRTDQGGELAELSTALEAPIVAGAVEGAGPRRFRNVAAVWWPGRGVVDRYEKVHRVPFGEWVPYRELVGRLADLSVVPRDAIAGSGSGVLDTPGGPVGVVISYEVFFADRARDAIGHGGEILLVPTNTASYRTTQVPEQELAAVRLRAWETGRWVVQASPTGHSLVVTPNGRVVGRTALDERAVLHATVRRRSGTTPYVRGGDLPMLVGAAVLVLAGAIRRRDA